MLENNFVTAKSAYSLCVDEYIHKAMLPLVSQVIDTTGMLLASMCT